MTDGVPTALPERDLHGLVTLVWGPDPIKPDIFRRWSQGFYYSHSEPSALEQSEGGPCSIIAPVQAFILKNLLLEHENLAFRDVDEQHQSRVLILALSQVLQQCNVDQYYLVDVEGVEQQNVGLEAFHSSLRVCSYKVDASELEKVLAERLERFKAKYGLLLFLYSVILTKGVETVRSESQPTSTNPPPPLDPWIDSTYGYGAQSVINLMLTGRAVTYVWDDWQDVDGLRLLGVDKQAQLGYVTLMEHLRYCTVGSYYKNPVHPVWVLGSETHLTVLFSDDRKIVSPETKSEQARRVFKSFDKDGNNFIKSECLQQVLAQLDLVSDPEYVEIMTKKLDSESFGIILLNAFMEEFFPKEENSTPDMFRLVHYNGLAQSNLNGLVKYQIGSAILLEGDLKSVCESNPMLTCLQTKWPSIEVNWCDNVTPSLN